jgi:hypothetical protein
MTPGRRCEVHLTLGVKLGKPLGSLPADTRARPADGGLSNPRASGEAFEQAEVGHLGRLYWSRKYPASLSNHTARQMTPV